MGGLLGKGDNLSINQKDMEDWRVSTWEKEALGRGHSIRKGLGQESIWNV